MSSLQDLSTSSVPGIRSLYREGTMAGAVIEYGAVEKYSGYSDIEPNYVVCRNDLLGEGTLTTGQWPYNKLQICLKRKVKNVYVAVGLLETLNVINELLIMTGQTAIPGPRFCDWSFRRDIIPAAQIPQEDGKISLRRIANFLVNYVPSDTSGSIPGVVVHRGDFLFTSYRGVLNPAYATQWYDPLQSEGLTPNKV